MDLESEIMIENDFIFYSLLYSSITLLFGMAVVSKFLSNEFRFGFRSILSLAVLFIGEPLCHFFLRGPTGVATFGFGCLFIYSILPASHLPVGNKSVLVTGCDSGFGHELVKKLDDIGMHVYAGCLDKSGAGATQLKNNCSNRVHFIQLDVTQKDQITAAVDEVTEKVKDDGLWGVVNNAGIWYAGDLELTPEKCFRRVMDINLMGAVAVTRAFLPLIRKAQGRIVNMTSVTGSVPFRYFGAYCVSKHALEAYSDVLRLEMSRWGVRVSTVQPAAFCTAGVQKSVIHARREELWSGLEEVTRAAYGKAYLDRLYSTFEASTPLYPTDLTPVIRALRSGLLSKRPRSKYAVGRGAGILLSVYPLLPLWLADIVAGGLSMAIEDPLPAALSKNTK